MLILRSLKLYNLMASRDSLTNIRIAVQSTKIAQETRRDSFAMKTIAVLTMLYLPATFVSSVFGTNFFAATGDGPGRSTVVSRNWWVGAVVAVGLTTVTLGVWVWAVRGGRERRREEE
jgi:Mg2+ and Co2+ transporter CorA